MLRITNFSAFIFDMDGLILDTEPTYVVAWQRAVVALGFRVDEDAFKNLSGYHYTQVEAQLLGWFGKDFNLHKFRLLSAKIWRNHVNNYGIAVKKGVNALLDYADQNHVPVCLATNSSNINAYECLEIARIKNRFSLIVTGDDVERVKPEPDIFLNAADKLQVDIRRCVVFEDSLAGIAAASAAGAYTVYVPSSLPVNDRAMELCDCRIDNLLQVFQSLPAQTAIRI